MLAAALFITGLVAIALAVGALAGIWWGVLAGGVMLIALAVLTEAGTKRAAKRGDRS